MSLTAQQLTYLKTGDQRFRARVALFPSYAPVITPALGAASTGTQLAPLPMPVITPRSSVVPNSGAINLYARDCYNRGGTYVGDANISWANTGGAGTLVDNGNGTATYTAPAVGSGTNTITLTATNANGSSTGIIYVQYPDTTNDATVAEIATISADVSSHGWKMSLRVRGDTSGYVIGAGILLHVEDTWNGTLSTFGGYQYPEGVFRGYITDTQYFEDQWGETWLGVECQSPWWILERTHVGETWWGKSGGSGRLYLSTFAPVDAIWHFVTKITDFSKYHNCTLFYDQNTISDLIVDESDLATIFADIMARNLATAWGDRYGSLMCIPDPDIRATEWWGTPAPVFEAAGAGALTEAFVQSYDITTHPYEVRKLTVDGVDSSKLGIWAISQNTASSLGGIVHYGGKLICDNAPTLAGWAAQLRAKMNRKWDMNVTLPLNHVVDLMNFVDVNFTNPTQTNGVTASGLTWVDSISYRPDIFNGGWQGQWHLVKTTSGDVDGSSAWGGQGQYWGGVPEWISAPTRSGAGSWNSAQTGGVTNFCYTANFQSGRNGWTITVTPASGKVLGTYAAGLGFSATAVTANFDDGFFTGTYLDIMRVFSQRYITHISAWFSAASGGEYDHHIYIMPDGVNVQASQGITITGATAFGMTVTANTTALRMQLRNAIGVSLGGDVIFSAIVCGSGASPF